MSRVYVFTDYGGAENQALIDRPSPVEPGSGELAVEVRAAGVNPADWKIRKGLFGRDRSLPAPMGLEVAGVVTAAGHGVTDFAVGEAVLGQPAPGMGGFADHTIIRAADAIAKPEEVSFADAATIPVAGTTAYDLTHQVELEAGQSMLILGAGGGVGLMAAQIGNVHQFRVIGVASETKRELVESTGATFVAAGNGFTDTVRGLAPDGVDLVIDLVGGEVLRQAAPLATEPSRVVSATDPAVTELGGATRQRDPEVLEKITGVIEYGLADPHVTATYPLNQAGDALAVVETGHSAGKTIIQP